jgi:XTP/dITP diphosphohydrolase
MQLVFASTNENKIKEIRMMLPKGYELITLKDLNYEKELEETGDTLSENALQKARFIHSLFRRSCFADDSGLETEALDGLPGVNSAHYSGSRNAADNMRLLLENMKGVRNRNAQFKTVIALITDDAELIFEGVLKGAVAEMPRGSNGFGYDPVFIPEGFNKTIGEMDAAEKAMISHRAKAVHKLMLYLQSKAA